MDLRRRVGSLSVSTAGLGCGNLGMFIDEPETRAVVNAALDLGINHFDTADVYGEGLSEEYLGRALGAHRPEVVIATKFGAANPPTGIRPASAGWVRRSCDASLRRLKTDWIDLYWQHQPDPATPIGETLAVLGDLQTEGKVREIGCSNFSPDQLDEAALAAADLGIPGFCAVQNSYSLLDRTAEAKFIPAATRLGAQLVPYLPLASGMLTGKYRRQEKQPHSGRLAMELRGSLVRSYFPALLSDQCFDVVEALQEYALERGRSLIDLALSWLASKPYVASVIAGATSPEQLRSNVTSMFAWQMTDDEERDVARITRADVAFTWNAGSPPYSQLPEGVDLIAVPNVRAQGPVLDG